MSRQGRAPDDNPHLAWCMALGVNPSTTTNKLADLTEDLRRRAGDLPPKAPPQKFPDVPLSGFDDALAAS